MPSYSSAGILEYGHARDHPDLEQINMGMVLERSRNIPMFFEIYSGSIIDIVVLKRTVESMMKPTPKIEIILDMRFFSHENLSLLKDVSFIIEVSLVLKAIKNAFLSASRSVDKADNVIMYENEPIFCLPVNFIMGDMNLRGHFFHDQKMESNAISDAENRMESTIRGILFVFFISLIVRSALMRGMISSGLINKYSMERMLLELEKLYVIENESGNMSELERTRKWKDILEALEMILWWQREGDQDTIIHFLYIKKATELANIYLLPYLQFNPSSKFVSLHKLR